MLQSHKSLIVFKFLKKHFQSLVSYAYMFVYIIHYCFVKKNRNEEELQKELKAVRGKDRDTAQVLVNNFTNYSTGW